jgi:hypothetical protein
MDPSMDPNAPKQANWWSKPLAQFAEQNGELPTETQLKAAAIGALFRSLSNEG